jgi:hypothetical protein
MESPRDDWMFVMAGDALRAEIKRREAKFERLRASAQHAVDRWAKGESVKHAMFGLRDVLEDDK